MGICKDMPSIRSKIWRAFDQHAPISRHFLRGNRLLTGRETL